MRRILARSWRCFLILVGTLVPAVAVSGAELLLAGSPESLKLLNLEQLMDIEVTTVARKPQRFHEVASAVTVITQEDIRRSGALSIPEVLRLSPGLHVARGAGQSYSISARGFSSVAGNKLQVNLDGRSLYTPLLSGVFWEIQDTLIEDIHRIEVVRGPGATMWGANAVNGVINILSKDARQTQGTLVMGGGGTEARGFGGVRYGGKLGESTFYRAYAKYRDFDQKVFADGSGAHDGLWQAQTGFRIDSFLHGQNELTFQGDIYRGEFELLNRDSAKNSGGNLLSRWTHRFSGESELRVQAYFDRSSRDVPLQFEEDRDTWDLDVQHRFALGERHEFIWGLEHKVSADDTARDGTVQFDPDHRTIQMASAFAQDEIALVPERLGLTLGSKFEHNDFTGFEIQPSIRLAYTPTRRQTWWAAVSRAVRTPTRAEDDIRFIPVPSNGRVLIRGDRGFESEEVLAYELGYRVQPHARLSLDLAAFYNEYDNLRSQEPTPGTIIPLVIRNEREGETYGGELAATIQATEWWRITGSYTYLQSHFRNKPGSLDTSSAGIEHNDPRHIVTLRSAMDLPRHWEFDWMIRYVDMLPNPRVPSYLVLDLRLGWEARPGLEIMVGAQNLLDDRHPEFGAAAPNRSEGEHSVYGKVTCRF